MSDLDLIARVAALHVAGPVVPLGPRGPKIPTVLIAGRKYVLSTDGGDLGDLAEEEFGNDPRIIRGPVSNKWKYLWVYDTDRQRLVMWRATDGNEKFEDSSRSQSSRIVRLERKGQLNRVTHEEFRKVETFMRKLEDEALESLQKSIELNKDDFQRDVDKALDELLDHLRPKLEAQLRPIEQGAVPFGWKPPEVVDNPVWVERSKRTFVISRFFEKEFSLEKCEDYLRSKGLDVMEPGRDSQAAQWARGDLMDATYERYLPERPE